MKILHHRMVAARDGLFNLVTFTISLNPVIERNHLPFDHVAVDVYNVTND